VKERSTELVQGFRHTVPYINTHRDKTFVIMLGGEAIEHENFSSIVNDIGLLHSLGIRLVVVYGARPQIDASMAQQQLEPIYHKHTRVTDAQSLELVKQAAGRLQLDITARLSMSLNNTPLQGRISTWSAATLLSRSRWASMMVSITATVVASVV
jgi:N-acetylglutamate synthase (EC 2.3.1.1)